MQAAQRACVDVEDALDELRDANAPFLGRYIVLGHLERRIGGQGIVQFLRDVHSGAGYAAKARRCRCRGLCRAVEALLGAGVEQ
jgi:hypothetical protein